MISGMNHVGISVANLDRSIAFYRDLLGMEVVIQTTFEDERYERILKKRFALGNASPADIGKLLGLRIGSRHDPMVAEWCEEDIIALSAISGAVGVVPFDAGTRQSQADPSDWFQEGVDEDSKAKVDELIAARDAARRTKDWPEADRIRAELTALNVEVMDGPQGATWRFKES